MKSKPILVKNDNNTIELIGIDPREKKFSEGWLQELLDKNPQILPVDEIEEIFSPLASIGREISIDGKYIDNLFISKYGYPVIVETKFWRNPDAKREVVAQIIDYAEKFSRWSFTQLNEICIKHQREGVLDFIESSFDMEEDEYPTEKRISRNLKQGRFLLLIVSDEIRNSVIDMMEYINKYPHLSTNIGLVELQTYQIPNTLNEYFIFPSIVAKTEIVERSVVQVNLLPDVEFSLSVDQKKVQKSNQRKRKKILSEDALWESIEEHSPQSVEKAKTIYNHFSNFDEISFIRRVSGVVARFSIPGTDGLMSLFYIELDGKLTYWAKVLREQAEAYNVPLELVEEYIFQLITLLKLRSEKGKIGPEIRLVNTSSFISIVEDFIQKISSVNFNRQEN